MPLLQILVLCCCLLLTACEPPRTDAIRFGLASAPTNLDPRFATDATSERINRLLYRRLVDFDAQARPVPSLATWETLSPTHYRFHLGNEGRVFHDGSRLQAADVAATYASILDEDNASPHRGALQNIQRIEVIDEDTLDYYLDKADALLPAWLTIGILPGARIDSGQSLARQPMGSGPFRLGRWPQRGTLQLVRSADGTVIEFEEVRDPTMRVLKLLNAEIDLIQNDLPSELLAYLRKQDDIDVATSPGSNFTYIGFQMQDEATGQLPLRKAVSMAIDRQAIIKHVFHGAARPASAVLPPEHWAGAASLPELHSSPSQARELLRQAGYDEQHPLVLSYKTSSDPFRLRIATIIQQQLAAAGIQVKVQSYDWGTFYGDIKAGRFQMYSLAWVGVKSPDIFRYAFHSTSLPPEGANRGRLNDPHVDQLIEQAMASADADMQATLYKKLQAWLLETLPYIPLWYEDQFYAARSDIIGYRLAADGNFDALVTIFRQPKHQH